MNIGNLDVAGREFLMDQCSMSPVVRSRPICFSYEVGPDGEDIYDNFRLAPAQRYDIDIVMEWFEEFCAPICNFRATWFKFTKVSTKSKGTDQ